MAAKIDTRKRLPRADTAHILQQGIEAQRAGEFQKAEFFYQTVLRDHPKNPDALNLMGTLAIEASKPDTAIGYFRKALKQRPREAMFLHNMGGAQLLAKKPQLAVETLRKSLKANPDFTDSWTKLSQAEAALGRHHEALDAINRAHDLTPENQQIAVERGELLVQLGRMDEASEVFRTLSTNNEELEARAMIGLASAHKFSADDSAANHLEQLAKTLPKTSPYRQSLLYSAGKVMADQKKYDWAFKYFDAAKTESGEKFPIALHREAYARHKTLFTPKFFEERRHLGHPSERPIFIVGMPRSGTTLTEQICASHPKVAGAGELSEMRLIANGLGFGDPDKTKFARTLTDLSEGMAKKLAGKYLAVLKRHSSGALHVIDKLPHNYELLGLITILFPNAKIIHCRRNAMDNCVSCFTHNFSDAHAYNNDLKVVGAVTEVAAPDVEISIPVPAPPDATTTPVIEATPLPPAEAVSDAVAEALAVVETPAAPTASSSGTYLQVATLDDAELANELIIKLQTAGIPAEIQLARVGEKTLYRIIAGPAASPEALEIMLSTVGQLGYKDAIPLR